MGVKVSPPCCELSVPLLCVTARRINGYHGCRRLDLGHPLLVKGKYIINYLVMVACCCCDQFSDRHHFQESWKATWCATAEGSSGKAYFARKVTKAGSPPLYYNFQGSIAYRDLESCYRLRISRFLTANAFPKAVWSVIWPILYSTRIFFSQ